MTIDVMRLIGKEFHMVPYRELIELATCISGSIRIEEDNSTVIGIFKNYTRRNPEFSVVENPDATYGYLEVMNDNIDKFFATYQHPDLVFRLGDIPKRLIDLVPQLKNINILEPGRLGDIQYISFIRPVVETKKKIKL